MQHSDSAFQLTRHASTRMQQRGVPLLILEWLDRYGVRVRDDRGAEVLYFSRESRRSLERAVGAPVVDRLRPLLDAYLVMSDDGAVITAGWRHKRLPRH